MERERLRTGEVAARAGVNVQTLRYYERRGLLKKPGRRASGYREYSPDAVRLIRFIKRAQELGFTLTEIEDLLRLRSDQTAKCSDVRHDCTSKNQGHRPKGPEPARHEARPRSLGELMHERRLDT